MGSGSSGGKNEDYLYNLSYVKGIFGRTRGGYGVKGFGTGGCHLDLIVQR